MSLIAGKVKREDLFITTKLPMMAMHPEDVAPFCDLSLKALGLDYLDLYLIHAPLGVEKDPKTMFIKFDKEFKVGNRICYLLYGQLFTWNVIFRLSLTVTPTWLPCGSPWRSLWTAERPGPSECQTLTQSSLNR